MTTTHQIYRQVAGKPRGTPPEIGVHYNVRHVRLGTFHGRVRRIRGEWATIEITFGVATAYFAEDSRTVGERVEVSAVHCNFLELEG